MKRYVTTQRGDEIGPVPVDQVVDCEVCDRFCAAIIDRFDGSPTLEEVQALATETGYEPHHLRYVDGVVVWNQARCCPLPPSAEKVMRALALAVIDPGERTWHELLVAVRPMAPHAMEAMAYLLEERGLATCDDWGVIWTELGRQHCITHRYPCTPRT